MNKVSPRITPDRNSYYMGMSFWIASKSKDPNTQIGAYIVSENNVPIAVGYNGPPAAYDDNELDWKRSSKNDPSSKNDHIIHAEENAILHCSNQLLLPGATLYVTAKPCKGCILRIAHVGIKKVIYFPFKGDSGSLLQKDGEIIEDIAKRGKVELIEFTGNLNWMRDRIKFMEEVLKIF